MDKTKIKKIFDLFDEIKKELNLNICSDKNQKFNLNQEENNDLNNLEQECQENQENQESIENQEGKENQESQQDKELSNIEKLELEFSELIEIIAKLEEDKMLAIADKQNIVRRFQNESILVRKYGGEKLASELIPAIDMFRGVLNSTPDNPETKNYLMGFEMIINQIDQALASSGVTLLKVEKGEDFNPEIHCAIEQVACKDFQSGKIVQVISNGYKLHDRVIKHAAVKVAE